MTTDITEMPRWVARQSIPGATAAEIRKAVCDDLMAISGARMSVFHNFAFIDGQPHVTDLTLYGDVETLSPLSVIDGQPVADWADIELKELLSFNSFTAMTADGIRHNKVYRLVWRRFSCKAVMSMNVMAGDEFIGWIGAHRVDGEADFSPEAVRAAQSRAGAYIHALEVARRLDGHGNAKRAVILMSATGEKRFACSEGEKWLEDESFAQDLQVVIRSTNTAPRSMHGAIIRVTELHGDGEPLQCVEIAPADHWRPSTIAGLSKRKRWVAQLAALGSTNKEIADAMNISVDTVRSHLRSIYEELGISSRVELTNEVHRALNSSES